MTSSATHTLGICRAARRRIHRRLFRLQRPRDVAQRPPSVSVRRARARRLGRPPRPRSERRASVRARARVRAARARWRSQRREKARGRARLFSRLFATSEQFDSGSEVRVEFIAVAVPPRRWTASIFWRSRACARTGDGPMKFGACAAALDARARPARTARVSMGRLTLEMGLTKVLALVSGPHEARRSAEQHDRATIACTCSLASFAGQSASGGVRRMRVAIAAGAEVTGSSLRWPSPCSERSRRPSSSLRALTSVFARSETVSERGDPSGILARGLR